MSGNRTQLSCPELKFWQFAAVTTFCFGLGVLAGLEIAHLIHGGL